MNTTSFADDLAARTGSVLDGQLTDFLSRRDGRLLLGHDIDLSGMVARYGAPLEVAFCPQIKRQVHQMVAWAAAARTVTGYPGEFVYAYATKANFAEEVVRTALAAGAHYETSATADVTIAHQLWRAGTLPGDRLMFCNGSKDEAYLDAVVALAEAGYEQLIPVIDSLDELDGLLRRSRVPLKLGVRERHPASVVDAGHLGGERFGLLPHEIAIAAARIAATPHTLVAYHAMVGSQLEDLDGWMTRLDRSAQAYASLRVQVPALSIFNFGGGMPTSAYTLDFAFDYQQALERMMQIVAAACAAADVPAPVLAGEFGRYTVASHSVYLIEVGATKPGQGDAPDWYLVNSSMMVTLPDMLFVEGQQFIVLPLGGWDLPAHAVRLGGRYTCDSDDYFPPASQPPLQLPASGAGTILAIFGIGAYQQMIAGRGGAHHCLMPEMRRIIIEQDDDAYVVREVVPQSLDTIKGALGYVQPTIEIPAGTAPARGPRRAATVFRTTVRR